jgi:uncharacterized RDD family membrane protein YckC
MDAVPAPERRFCSECGRPWPAEDLARFGDRLICADCKNIFTQKLREGVAPAVTFVYGGFWIRFVAILIDGIILFLAQTVVRIALLPRVTSFSMDVVLAAAGISYLVGLVLGSTYEAFFVSRLGATPGKMALGLKVVRPDGGPVSLGRAYGRYFGKILSGMILGIGYIIAGFDAQKRALHDLICDTRVIRTRI